MNPDLFSTPCSQIIVNTRQRARWACILYTLTVLYFLLPCLIFLVGFTKWYVALLAGVPLIASVFCDLRLESSFSSNNSTKQGKDRAIYLIFLLAFIWTALFGAGFIGPQTSDQLKSHMIFRDLFALSWPVILNASNTEYHFLSYPLGYYLVPAITGKIFGWSIGCISIYLWTAIGIFLLWSWFRVFFSGFVWLAIVIFVLFSGLDALGRAIVLGQALPTAGTRIEWWSGWTFLQYSSNAHVMSWATQHGAAQWLLPTLLFYRLVCKNTIRGSVLTTILASFWSHLTLIGAVIFVPLILKNKELFTKSATWPAILALPFFIVVLSFYAAKAPGAITAGFIWDLWTIDFALPRLIWFELLEFGILGFFIYAAREFPDRREFWLFLSAIVLLVVIPVYHIGWSNDVSLRVSAIPLFILFIFFVSTIVQGWRENNRYIISFSAMYILLAIHAPLNNMFVQISQMLPQNFFISNVTDSNWNRGVSRAEPNCLITSLPKGFNLKPGDQMDIYGNGRFLITRAWLDGRYQNLCGPADLVIRQRTSPIARLNLHFYRGGRELKEKLRILFKLNPDEIPKNYPSVGQYTGSQKSLFYKYLFKKNG